jgi:hypothetical protein
LYIIRTNAHIFIHGKKGKTFIKIPRERITKNTERISGEKFNESIAIPCFIWYNDIVNKKEKEIPI